MKLKLIKFDLPINGTKVKDLDELRDNLTDEILALARSGQLERWLGSRQLLEEAQGVAAAVRREGTDKGLFLALCVVLGIEVHPCDVKAIFDEPPVPGRFIPGARYFELYEELVAVKKKDLYKISMISFGREVVGKNRFVPYQMIDAGYTFEVVAIFIKNGIPINIGGKIAEVKVSNDTLDILSPINGFVEEILIKVGDKIKEKTAMVNVLVAVV